jgi:hypothetical protein
MSQTPEIIETNETVEELKPITRQEVSAMIASANESIIDDVRQVQPKLVNQVIERTYLDTEGLPVRSRNFAIRRAVTNYIDLQTKGLVASAAPNHTDLLTPANPYSTAATVWDEDTLRQKRATWAAAEPGVSEEHRALIAAAYMQKPGSVEALHAEVRLTALTAGGAIPAQVLNYGHALTAGAAVNTAPTNDEMYEYYEESRAAFLELLDAQSALTASGSAPFDWKGDLTRRVYRGDTRHQILSHLSQDEEFAQNVLLLNEDLSDTDMYTRAGQAQFQVFYDALCELADAPQVIDLRERAAKAISKYDETGEIAQAIVAGASTNHVLSKLHQLESWNLDNDYLNVDSESDRAAEFAVIYESVLDIDGESYDYDSLREVLPEK